jgi:hypothetical protein
LQNKIASAGKGILAMDESNATCGKRLESIGLENTELNRQRYRELLVTTPGLGEYISGAILFEETLYQETRTPGKTMVDCLNEQELSQESRLTRVFTHLPTPTESLGALDSMDSPRDALTTTRLELVSPSGDLLFPSQLDHPPSLCVTALMDLLAMLLLPRTLDLCQLLSQRFSSMETTTLTAPSRLLR